MARYVTLEPNAVSGKGTVAVETAVESVSAPSDSRRYSVPFFIPRDQAYYWSHEWQQGETEADEELRGGQARAFDDPNDALRWLDAPED